MEEIDGVVYKVESRMVNEGGGIDAALIGANPGEGEVDDVEDEVKKVNDISGNGHFTSLELTYKQFLSCLKPVMKKLMAKAVEAGMTEADYKEKIMKFCGEVQKNIDNCSFYYGPTEDGMLIVSMWENGTDEYFFFFKHGLEEVKL